MMWITIFLLFTFCLFLLPLLPSILELCQATDTAPLRIIQEYDTDITYFATGFKQYLKTHFADFFSDKNYPFLASEYGILKDRTHFQIIHHSTKVSFNEKEIKYRHTDKLIIAGASLELPENMLFEKEIYSAGLIITGADSQFRSILAEDNIILGKGCTILRWIHSWNSITIGRDCALYGRVSAQRSIFMNENCRFERINAPQILLGNQLSHDVSILDVHDLTILKTLPNLQYKTGNRWLVNGDINIPELHFFEGNLIATGNIIIGNDSTIKGSIKSNKMLTLGRNTQVTGAVVSAGDIRIAAGCNITGPIIAEGNITIESGSSIGLENSPTTISAQIITIISGVTVYGTIWAEESAKLITGEIT